MAEKGCEDILLSFLNAVFKEYDKKIKSVEIIENKVIEVDFKDEKNCIVDLRAKTDNDEKIIIEMQQRNANEFRGRSLHYICNEFSKSVKKSKNYNYKPHILISIVNFNFCKKSNFHEKFDILSSTNNECKYLDNDLFNFYVIDLKKFKKVKEKDLNNELVQWCIFLLKNDYSEKFQEVLNLNEKIKEAHIKVVSALSEGEDADLYDRVAMKRQEIKHEIRDAKIEAEKKGREEGIEKGKKEIAKKLKNNGNSLEEIAEITNLPIETIKTL